MNDIVDAAVELDAIDELPADGPLAKMADDKKKEKAKKTDDDSPAFKALQREVAVLKMAPATKTYFDALDTAGQAALERKSTRLNSSHYCATRMPSSA